MGKVDLISLLYKVLWKCCFLRKLLFQSLCFLRIPVFSKQLYFFAKATFSEDAVYWNSQFSTTNLVFTVTLFIYHLEINHGVHRVLHHSKNLFIKYHYQKFYIKFAFSGQHLTRLSIEKFKNSVFGVLIKISVSVLNQPKTQQFITCCYSLQFILIKMARGIPLK